jgi:hypothetical protein
VWVSLEHLYWKIKDAPQPFPLLTTGSATDSLPGALGQPGTQVLFGGGDIDFERAHGYRVGGGIRLDKEGCCSLEGNVFILERTGQDFAARSDDSGLPVLALPFTSTGGTPSAAVVSQPGLFGQAAGNVYITTSSKLWGNEINFSTALYRGDALRFDFLIGFRYLNLEENLAVNSSQDLSATILFGIPLSLSTQIRDSFETRNRIYAPQLGARLTWDSGPLSASLFGKVGLGVNDREVDISGQTTQSISVAGTQIQQTAAAAGLLAARSNIGTYSKTDFVVTPEAGVNFGLNVFPWMRVTGGYSFLYINKVSRPGEQIDPVVNLNFAGIPNGTSGPRRPAFTQRDSDFFAHGFNGGLMFRW